MVKELFARLTTSKILQWVFLGTTILFSLLWFFDSCKKVKIIESVKIDTTIVQGPVVRIPGDPIFVGSNKIDTIPVLIPIVTEKEKIIYKYIDSGATQEDYDFIYSQYTKQNYFKNKVNLPDNQGFIEINDTVSLNSIIGRSFTSQINTKTITKTITQELPKRNQLLIGAEIAGTKNDYFRQAGVNLILRAKNEKLYSIGASRDFLTNTYIYKAGMAIPIKFK